MIYKLAIRIPFIGHVIKIVNTYVYGGDFKSDKCFAPLLLWIKTFWISFTLSAVMTCLSSDQLHEVISLALPFLPKLPSVNLNVSPADLILLIFPNLLGFGIGVYALIFALSSKLLNSFQIMLNRSIEDGKRKNGSVLMLNSDLAYPLIVLVLTIFCSVIEKVFPYNNLVTNITWFAFWFSLITIVDLIATLFSIGENELLTKIIPEDEQAKETNKS